MGAPGSGGATERYRAPVGVEFSRMRSVFLARSHQPARRFLDIVAPFTLTQPIERTGRPTTITRRGVITMPNRSITERSPTRAIPQPDESRQTLWEEPRS